MTIYERDISRQDVTKIGPDFKDGPCEPYKRTLIVPDRNWLKRKLFGSEDRTIMDVGEDEIYVLEVKPFDANRRRNVVGPQINIDPLTREFFIYKSEE